MFSLLDFPIFFLSIDTFYVFPSPCFETSTETVRLCVVDKEIARERDVID